MFIPKNQKISLFDFGLFDNRLVAVVSALITDVMATHRGPTVGTGAQRGGNRLVVGSPLGGTLFGMSVFWIWHDSKKLH